MRIALVSVSDQLGGSEVVLLQVVEHVRRARPDWQVHVILPGDGPLAGRAASLGAQVHMLPFPPALAALGEWGSAARPLRVAKQLTVAAAALPAYERAFATLLGSIEPDVVHSNGFKAHIVAARTRTKAAVVWHMHEYVSSRRVTRRLLRRYAGVPQSIIANSESVAADVRGALHGRTSTAVAVVHNGVNVRTFSPEGPSLDLDMVSGLAPAPAGTVRIGLVATFARWKGHDVFLRALGQLRTTTPWRGYVIGAPLYDTAGSQWSFDELRAIAADAGVQDRVGFAGFQDDAPAAFRALDIVVHPSVEQEPFGLVVAEAMACGRPVTTSGFGGSREIVRSGESALLHDTGDPASLARSIDRLADDAALRRRLGRAGRAIVEQRFNSERFGEAIVERYESLRGAGVA